jgi:hypothetical protein
MAVWPRLAFLLVLLAGTAVAQDLSPTAAQSSSEGDTPLGVLLAVGDISQCGDGPEHQHDEAIAELAGQEIERAQAEGLPVRLLLLGDLAYGQGSREQFEDCFDPAWGRFNDLVLPVPGNHEYKQPAAKPFFRYFREAPLEADGTPLVTSEGRGFYDLRFPDPANGPWLLLGLNSGPEGAVTNPRWLRDALEDNQEMGTKGARCVLAFAHHFLFSSGQHGHGFDTPDPAAPLVPGEGMRPAFDLLDRFGASVLLSGHDHHFEQFGPQDAQGNADPKGLRSSL